MQDFNEFEFTKKESLSYDSKEMWRSTLQSISTKFSNPTIKKYQVNPVIKNHQVFKPRYQEVSGQL